METDSRPRRRVIRFSFMKWINILYMQDIYLGDKHRR